MDMSPIPVKPPPMDWGFGDDGKSPFTSIDDKRSPFSDKPMSPKEARYAEFEDGPDAKKKYFVINADDEVNILCHTPEPKGPEEALREALSEIESLKFKLSMTGDG